jgi:hypothetical protein
LTIKKLSIAAGLLFEVLGGSWLNEKPQVLRLRASRSAQDDIEGGGAARKKPQFPSASSSTSFPLVTALRMTSNQKPRIAAGLFVGAFIGWWLGEKPQVLRLALLAQNDNL